MAMDGICRDGLEDATTRWIGLLARQALSRFAHTRMHEVGQPGLGREEDVRRPQ
jgi:hypothetical protein